MRLQAVEPRRLYRQIADQIRRLIAKVLDSSAVTPISLIRNYPNMLRLNSFLRKLVKLRREQPGDDLVTALVQAEEGGDRLSEDELISMVFLLLFAGHETTVNLIGNGVLELVRHPEQLQKLREQPDLIDSAIEEMLRFTNPVGVVAPRFAKAIGLALGSLVWFRRIRALLTSLDARAVMAM